MPRPRTNFPPLASLLADFATYQRRRGMAVWTIQKRRYRLLGVSSHVDPRHILQVSTEDLERWLDSLELTSRTRATYVSEIRVFYDWATNEVQLIGRDPARRLSVPRRRKSLPRPIADDALGEALSTAPPRLLAILSLMAYEGLRCMEVSGLRGEDVDRDTMTLRLRGKGDKERMVPLHEETLAALTAYRLPARGPVFVPPPNTGHDTTRPIAPQTVSRIVSAALPGGYTAHQLRHWFGTMFYRASGGDLLLTQKMMGHADSDTTAGYAAADVSKAAGVVAGLRVGGWPKGDRDRDTGHVQRVV
jgi:integrase/recombinase XerC